MPENDLDGLAAGATGCRKGYSRRSRGKKRLPTALTMLMSSAPQNADQNPVTWKARPSAFDSSAVSHSMSAFSTSRNTPSVRMMSGQVRSLMIGRISAFTRPNTSATPSSPSQLPSCVMPGTSATASQSAAAVIRKRMRNMSGGSLLAVHGRLLQLGEPLQCADPIGAAHLRMFQRDAQPLDGLVVGFSIDGEGRAVLAPVREAEARGIARRRYRDVEQLRDQQERAERLGADRWRAEHLLEVRC